MEYLRIREGLEWAKPLESSKDSIRFLAKGIRSERTGIHALITIGLNTTRLTWSNFNIERDEDRRRLAGHATKELKTLRPELVAQFYPEAMLRHDLDLFCAGLWNAFIGKYNPVEEEGSSERTETTFLLKPYVLAQGGTIMFGPPGAGKSNIALAMAVSIDANLNGIWAISQTKVLYINLERPQLSVLQRLGNINEAFGLKRNRKLTFLHARGRSLSDVYDSAQKYVEENKVGLVVLDSLTRVGYGSLVKDEHVNAMIDHLNALSPSWLALGHTPRENPEHVWGLQLFDAGADCLVKLSSILNASDELGICLEITKANDFLPPSARVYKFSLGKDGVKAFAEAEHGEFVELLPTAPGMRYEIMDYLRERGQATATQIAKAITRSRARVSDILRNDKKTFVPTKRGTGGSAGQYYGLLTKETNE